MRQLDDPNLQPPEVSAHHMSNTVHKCLVGNLLILCVSFRNTVCFTDPPGFELGGREEASGMSSYVHAETRRFKLYFLHHSSNLFSPLDSEVFDGSQCLFPLHSTWWSDADKMSVRDVKL